MTGTPPGTDNAEKGPLAGSGLEHLASVYEALADVRGMTPREADDLYLWEIAVILGLNRPDSERMADSGDPHAHLRARVEARAAGLPEPEWDAPNQAEVAAMMALMDGLQA